MTRLALLISTFGYAGFFPFAPGTVGSLAGLVVYAAFARLGGGPQWDGGLIVGLLVVGVFASTRTETYLGQTDPGAVVIDEVVGMLVTLFGIRVTPVGALVGFLLFRALDIVKPFPAGRLEKLPGGMGIMADDVMAALYCNLLLRLAAWLVPGLVG